MRLQGEFASDVRCGWGRATMPDGSWYEGEWDRDRMHGQGALTHADGSYFEGTFREVRGCSKQTYVKF